MDTVCALLSNNKIKITVEDFNTTIRQESFFSPIIRKSSLHMNSNDNGTRLLNIAMSRDMVISSTISSYKDKANVDFTWWANKKTNSSHNSI